MSRRPTFITAVVPRLRAATLFGSVALGACAADAAPPREGTAQAVTGGVAEAALGCIARAADALPGQLSQLGCFDAQDPRWPAPSTFAFEVNAPLWADGADKERLMAIPEGTRIELDARGDFVLPVGTVLAKTFSVGGARVETRVMMRDATTGWHGASYRWREDGLDADLAPEEGMTLPASGARAEAWTIPGRNECFACHTEETHVALGLEVAQLNRDFVDPHTGESGNQLDRLIARGLLDGQHAALADRATRPKLADYHDASVPVAARARAYLHANCSSCHTRAEGFCTGDLRADTSDAGMGVFDVAPKFIDPSYGWPADTRLLVPGAPERSAIVHRMSAPGGSPLAMPPIGRHAVDAEGIALVTEWIASLRGPTP